MAVSTSMASEKPPVYIIQPGDQLDIKFFYNPELNENVTVRPDGMISLQLVDEVNAAGMSPAQLDDVLTQKYSHELKKRQPVPVRVDLKTAVSGVGGEAGTSLQAQDVVYVPKSAIAEANKFVKQYIEDLLLFRGVSLGFSYELHSDSQFNR